MKYERKTQQRQQKTIMGISLRKVPERHCQQAYSDRGDQPRHMQNDKVRFSEFRSHELKRPACDSS